VDNVTQRLMRVGLTFPLALAAAGLMDALSRLQ
jgi:hypothetical protein